MPLRHTVAGASLAVVAAAPALAAPDGWAPLLTAEALARVLEADASVRVVDVRDGYAAGHIPGAVAAPYAAWRGPADNPGQLPETAALRSLVQDLGITPDTPVVVVHQGNTQSDFGTAARVYWTLKSLGVEDLAVLNGGHAAWVAAGEPVTTDAAAVEPSDYAPELSDAWRVTSAEIGAMTAAGEPVALIDARPDAFFQGLEWHDAAARPGTLPGAENLTFNVWFEGDSTEVVGPEAARAIAEAQGATDAPLTVSFCNTGHWAAINWFAFSELAEVPNTRLYAESMVEWSQTDAPMMNQPSRLTHYWRLTRNWLNETF
jgi:thiosulfate/3-mercaptopyruvate sulfurtransferase